MTRAQKQLKTILAKNQSKFRSTAYGEYSPSDLAGAVGFFAKRATHRSIPEKALKDLQDAEAYLTMLKAKIEG